MLRVGKNSSIEQTSIVIRDKTLLEGLTNERNRVKSFLNEHANSLLIANPENPMAAILARVLREEAVFIGTGLPLVEAMLTVYPETRIARVVKPALTPVPVDASLEMA